VDRTLNENAAIQAVSPAMRIARIALGHTEVRSMIERMLKLSEQALPTMFRSDRHEFGFTMKRRDHAKQLEGSSVRYGAIVLLGAGYLEEELQRQIFGGESAFEFCGRLIAAGQTITNAGDLALIAWAAAMLEHPKADVAFDRLQERLSTLSNAYTVEIAWALSALSAGQELHGGVKAQARVIQRRLIRAFNSRGDLFGRYVPVRRGVRGHVGCFADQVYPIQALSRFHHAFGGDQESLDIAARVANKICSLQGPDGQWWWHYDVRTGQVVEGYPVYSVHQNSMAPMALLDLQEAGGPDHSQAIRRGVMWMGNAAEINQSLIDEEQLVIWRKVCRNDPKKLVRKLRAAASWIHPALRLRIFDLLFRPESIDFECRPYHLGWILHAWLGGLG
jgi:hypothetical protein